MRFFFGFSSSSNDAKRTQEYSLHKKYDLVFKIKELDFPGACRALMNDRTKARLKDSDGYLPMHLTLMNRGSERLITLLIDAYPGALTERDPVGRLPFHIICKDPTCLLTFVQFVLKASPRVLEEKDPLGDLPLHMSIRYRCPAETSLFLLSSYPGATQAVDKNGNLPLHLALRFCSEHELIYAILSQNVDAVNVRNKRGDLPLHRAALFNADLVVLKALLRHSQDSITATDSQGNLPIHLYFMQLRGGRPNDDVLHFFLEENPASLGVKNKAKCNPFEILEKYHEQIEKYLE